MNKAMRKFIKEVCRSRSENFDQLARRAEVAEHIAKRSESGKVAVELNIFWVVDCVSRKRTVLIPASVIAYEHLLNRQDDEAMLSGVEFVKPSEAKLGRGKATDHLTEAHENGHPHCIRI